MGSPVSLRQRFAACPELCRRAAALCVALLCAIASVRWGGMPRSLEVPVAGLPRERVTSTWHAARSGGRRHEGIDLFARPGTPVVSASRGVVWKVGNDPLGGQVVTVLGEGPALYYYAHLDTFASGLRRGDPIERGAPVGTVGNTGNARTTPSHLHFGVYRIGALRIRAVDPAPYLRATPGGAALGSPERAARLTAASSSATPKVTTTAAPVGRSKRNDDHSPIAETAAPRP